MNVCNWSESADHGVRRECPILLKADIQHGGARCLGFARNGRQPIRLSQDLSSPPLLVVVPPFIDDHRKQETENRPVNRIGSHETYNRDK